MGRRGVACGGGAELHCGGRGAVALPRGGRPRQPRHAQHACATRAAPHLGQLDAHPSGACGAQGGDRDLHSRLGQRLRGGPDDHPACVARGARRCCPTPAGDAGARGHPPPQVPYRQQQNQRRCGCPQHFRGRFARSVQRPCRWHDTHMPHADNVLALQAGETERSGPSRFPASSPLSPQEAREAGRGQQTQRASVCVQPGRRCGVQEMLNPYHDAAV